MKMKMKMKFKFKGKEGGGVGRGRLSLPGRPVGKGVFCIRICSRPHSSREEIIIRLVVSIMYMMQLCNMHYAVIYG